LTSLASSLLTGPASGQQPFFNDITIYGMSQKTFAQYTMINPLITNWTHDTYDYAQGNGIITHSMTFRYETVKYYSGDIGGDTPSEQMPGFADPSYYDTTKSPIAPSGSTNQVVQNGTLVSVPQGTVQDLQALNTGQNTLQNVIGAVGQGLVPAAAGLLGGALAGSGSQTQALLAGLAPALAGGTPQAAQQAQNSPFGFLFSTPDGTASPPAPASLPGQAVFNTDGTVQASNLNGYPDGAG
jgi:hypothetical protein